jgi:membrane protease subunit (stomatin/prohibitin family)
MGLIKAGAGSIGGALADQWKEFIYCDSIPADVLVRKGQKRRGRRSSNTEGSDNVITNGSVVVVNDGQCMVIVEQGKVVEFCAEAGEFTYNTSIAPSLFTGGLGQGLLDTFKNVGKRFTFGGETGVDQRVYYFNTKEIVGNKYGTANPVPFRVVDNNIGLDIDISVRCNGEFSYKVVDPLLFYANVCGNVEEDYKRTEIQSMLRSELLTALQPAFAKISAEGVRYSAVPAHTAELADALNEQLSSRWTELRGLKIVSFGVSTIVADEEDEQMIKNLQKTAVMRDPRMAAAMLTGAQADAMVGAANNANGAMLGFAGMNMANGMGGMNAASLYQMGGMGQPGMGQPQPAPMPAAPAPAAPVADAWTCPSCGAANTGKFCMECGTPKPAPEPKPATDSWTCPSCGASNTGKFCMECGTPRPAETEPEPAPHFRCDKCGWEPEDPNNIPKFCPNCGDRFDENDRA